LAPRSLDGVMLGVEGDDVIFANGFDGM